MDAFTKFKTRTLDMSKIAKSKKNILVHFLTYRVRSYFINWKNQSEMKAVVNFNNEEGSVRVEVH
jgi:hypothetical protein